ncbi:MAG TPA: hypothetical protein VGV38_05960, partial [Pyrinomonadaceae bacterium]|nr:hypothetical protein [Pyrinomonadaceae bacterium]
MLTNHARTRGRLASLLAAPALLLLASLPHAEARQRTPPRRAATPANARASNGASNVPAEKLLRIVRAEDE